MKKIVKLFKKNSLGSALNIWFNLSARIVCNPTTEKLIINIHKTCKKTRTDTRTQDYHHPCQKVSSRKLHLKEIYLITMRNRYLNHRWCMWVLWQNSWNLQMFLLSNQAIKYYDHLLQHRWLSQDMLQKYHLSFEVGEICDFQFSQMLQPNVRIILRFNGVYLILCKQVCKFGDVLLAFLVSAYFGMQIKEKIYKGNMFFTEIISFSKFGELLKRGRKSNRCEPRKHISSK
jgi:hypothetical protein